MLPLSAVLTFQVRLLLYSEPFTENVDSYLATIDGFSATDKPLRKSEGFLCEPYYSYLMALVIKPFRPIVSLTEIGHLFSKANLPEPLAPTILTEVIMKLLVIPIVVRVLLYYILFIFKFWATQNQS